MQWLDGTYFLWYFPPMGNIMGSFCSIWASGGVRRPALRLEEAGHAVLGYTVSLGGTGNVGRLLDTFERREYSPDIYDREVVEVVTEGGERVQSYVNHCQEVDRSNPVQGGDWLQHLQH
ncbi:hypothetical protein L7F22_012149 [Adiantum nelumboides]|nr:hypothetical protein [Adiantum nelumboides]